MNVEGMTRENVASHLQKYRMYLKRLAGITGNDPIPASILAQVCVVSNQPCAPYLSPSGTSTSLSPYMPPPSMLHGYPNKHAFVWKLLNPQSSLNLNPGNPNIP